MKYKLEDIDKKHPFSVPDGYFEELPLKIQGRVTSQKVTSFDFSLIWKFGLALAPVVLIAFFLFLRPSAPTSEDLIAEVSNEDLVAYLETVDIGLNEIAGALGEDIIQALDVPETLDNLDIEQGQMDDLYLEYGLDTEIL